MLITLTNEYESTIAFINDISDTEFMEFHARRLVEMAGNIIMGYLLLIDTSRNEDYSVSAEIFIKNAVSENRKNMEYITTTELKDLGLIKFNN